MLNNKKIVVVLPAYNAEKTLEKTIGELPHLIVDEVILTDDYSKDKTVELAQKLSIKHIIKHPNNKGYGANQKTCFDRALSLNADIIVLLHPDYQYTPKLIHAMCCIIADGVYPVVFGSRILGKGALKGGMPIYKYIANRFLTFVQNIIINQKLSEYHTGLRAYSSDVLRQVNYNANKNGFIFDNEIISQIFMKKYEIGEITCPTRYFKEASSINLRNSIIYGLGVLRVSAEHFLHKNGFKKFKRYN